MVGRDLTFSFYRERMMKLHVLSDLHIEFSDIKLPKVDSDIIILAGDIHIGTKGFNWIKNKFKGKQVIYVLGNHEYYHNSLPKLTDVLINKSKGTNVHVLENDELIIDDVVFLGCTLWTDFELYGDAVKAADYARSMMNDFHLIKTTHDYKLITTDKVVSLYNESFNWLKNKIKKHKGKKIVVVTHNGPSLKSCLPKYKNDILTAAFVVDLEGFINDGDINIWIHGHIHNSANYMIGNTRVICNPRGYCRNFGVGENYEFDGGLVVDV